LANRHPDDRIEEHSAHVKYKEPLLPFHGDGKAFRNVNASAGPAFSENYSARGMAIGDFNNGVWQSLAGSSPDRKERQSRRNRRPHHIQAGDPKRSRLKIAAGSYLSSHDPREVMGIGPRAKVDRLEIRWPQPSTRVDVFTDLPIDRYITIVEGAGIKRA
jgi:hypothetical protein